ncbi:hypothetical protein, partial [Staphylococcus epidermidis]|uniref:hypothetical protein n=1 Tax=Staphylococcus epidermidis TaxID=1282 RepID=UPI003C745EA0
KIYKKDNFYIISIEIVFFSLIQELYVPDSIKISDLCAFHVLFFFLTFFCIVCVVLFLNAEVFYSLAYSILVLL